MVAKRSVDGSDSNSVSSAGLSSTEGPTFPVVSDFRPELDAVPEDTDLVAAVFAHERKAKERELEGFRADTRRMLPGNAADLLEENQLNLFRDGNLWQAVWEGNIANVEKYAMQEYLGPDYLEAGQTVVAPGEKRLRGAHERGGEGETILHIAVLLKHKRLAEWIVTTFRSLVNETYLKHKYFGETALHIAVVNSAPEDISLVEFLVEKEAHINGPLVTGTEFLKDEDKGSIYYGQTILQFAASVKKEKIVRYLVEKGALLHDIDIYGNNVLHVMAYHGDINVELFHWLRARNQVEIKKELAEMKKHNPDLSLSFMKEYTNRRDITKARNKDNLTPFQVGVARGHVQIIDACKEILWEFGRVRQYRILLDDIDPIQPHSELNESQLAQTKRETGKSSSKYKRVSKSAIEIATEREDKAMLSQPLFKAVLKIKWALYGRRYFMREMMVTFMMVACLLVAISLQPFSDLNERRNYSVSDANRHPIVRGIFEVLVVVGTLVVVSGEFRELRVQGFRYFTGYGAAKNVIQWLFAVLIWTVPILRWGVAAAVGPANYMTVLNAENVVLGISAITGCAFCLTYAVGFQKLGPLFLIFKRMILDDFLRWIVLYACLTIGFASALFLQMQQVPYVRPEIDSRTGIFEGKKETIDVILPMDWNQFAGALLWTTRFIFMQAFFDHFRSSRIPAFTEFIYIVYGVVVLLLLFNVLIAMLAETLKAVAKDAERTWRVQFAYLLMQIDDALSDKHHGEVLGHMGWTEEHEIDPVTKQVIVKANDSRYLIFTERDSVESDSHGESKPKKDTLKLIVARDKDGNDVEVTTEKDHWDGWANDVWHEVRQAGVQGHAKWWTSHDIRVHHDPSHHTFYQKVNDKYRHYLARTLGLREGENHRSYD